MAEQPKPAKKQKRSVPEAAPDSKDQIIQDYTNTLKRLQADFENYIKRAEKERAQHQQYGAAQVLHKILTIVDDFDRASALVATIPHDELKQGITMIHTNLTKFLADEGVQPIPALGQKFDPYKHEIIDIVESDKGEGIILAELQKGYTYNGTVLRTSKVRVAKQKQPQEVKNNV